MLKTTSIERPCYGYRCHCLVYRIALTTFTYRLYIQCVNCAAFEWIHDESHPISELT